MRHLGFQYIVGHRRGSRILSVERVLNLMPLEGINHMFNVEFHAVAQVSTWFVGIFEGNYTPVSTDIMATFPSVATETVAYVSATRPEWVEGAATLGTIDNAAAEAVFVLNADKLVRGAFLSSSAVKAGVAGVLASAARFATPKDGQSGDEILVTVPFELVSTT